MALDYTVRYPGQIGPATGNYPYGAAQNITLPGDNTGTPWEADLVNDIFGILQWILSESGVSPSGVPDTVPASQYGAGLSVLMGRVFPTLTAALAYNGLVDGQPVVILGRTAANGQGYNRYIYRDPSAQIADGGKWIDHPAGGQLEGIFPNGLVTPEQFGAVGDGVADDRSAIIAADAYGKVTFTQKYRVSASTTLTHRANFLGDASILPDASATVFFDETQGDIYGRWLGLFGGGAVADESKPFQDALNSAAGRTLVIDTTGAHLLQAAVEIDSGTYLCIADGAIIFRNAAIDNLIRNKSDGVTGLYGANSGITIDGGIWDGNLVTFGSNATLVAFGHCDQITVKNATIQNFPNWHGIEFNAVSNGKIKKCKFFGWSRSVDTSEAIQLDLMFSAGAFPWFGPYDNTPCASISIEGCRFEDGGTGIGTHTATSGVVHQDITITRCRMFDLEFYGVRPYNWTAVKINKNRFVQMNRGVSPITAATVLSDYEIRGNTFFDMTVGSQGRAVWFNGVDATNRYFREIDVSHNFVRQVGRHGIGLDYCQYVTVSTNRVRACARAGIWFFGCATFTGAGNVAQGNNTDADPNTYDFTVGDSGASDTIIGCITGNTFSTGRVNDVNEVLMRQNTADVSLSVGTTSGSSTNENLVAGVLT